MREVNRVNQATNKFNHLKVTIYWSAIWDETSHSCDDKKHKQQHRKKEMISKKQRDCDWEG